MTSSVSRVAVLATACAILAATLVGCGSGSSEPSAATFCTDVAPLYSQASMTDVQKQGAAKVAQTLNTAVTALPQAVTLNVLDQQQVDGLTTLVKVVIVLTKTPSLASGSEQQISAATGLSKSMLDGMKSTVARQSTVTALSKLQTFCKTAGK